VVLCSGHVWAALVADKRRADNDQLAIVRLEELYPFPSERLADVLDRYASADEIIWLQEEPSNMGAWPFVSRMLREREIRYVGRPESPSPAEGWAEAHAAEQARLISAALEPVAAHA
jgi:2-oxoglutarate dehydrogenase E1 component